LDLDDPDPNSVFARVFLELLDQPGHPLKSLASERCQRVKKLAGRAGHDQFQAVYDLLDGGLVLVAADKPAESVAEAPAKTPDAPPENDLNNLTRLCGLGRDDWVLLEKSDSCTALDLFCPDLQGLPRLDGPCVGQDRSRSVPSRPPSQSPGRDRHRVTRRSQPSRPLQ